jgi:predicted ATP-grasp superfamily ATP-dependent carboligase
MADHRVALLGIDTPIGLTIIRELAQHGVKVYGIGRSCQAVGLHSRFLHRAYLRPKCVEDLVSLLNKIGAAERVQFLMTVSESDILFIHQQAQNLSSLIPLVPGPAAMAKVIDKSRTYKIARGVGLEVPATWEVRNTSDIERVIAEATYPVVLKWANPNAVTALLARLNLPWFKSEYCYNPAELRAALGRYAQISTYPMVQSFCPGHGLGQMVLMAHGDALVRFQHHRLHEWPPEGGLSTVCESVGLGSHQELFEKSVELLRQINWEGPAMVEYRYDPDSGRAAFVEVNGRFWGSLPLAYHAGAYFAWTTYAALGLGVEPQIAPYKEGVRCRYMIPETRRLLTILFRPHAIQNKQLRFNKRRELLSYLFDFFYPHTRYYVFTWRDPWPCFRDCGFVIRKTFDAILNRFKRSSRVGPENRSSGALF